MPPSPIDRNTPRSTTARSHDNPGYKPKTTAHQAVEAMKAPWRFEKALAGIKTGRHFEPLAWDKFNTALWGKPLASVLNAMDIPTSRAFVAAASGIATGMPSAIAAGLVTMNANLPLLETMFDHDGPQADAPLFERLAVMGLRFATDPQWAISKLGWGLAVQADSTAALSQFHRIIAGYDTTQSESQGLSKSEARVRAIATFVENFSLQTDDHPSSGQWREITDAIIATALSDSVSPREQLVALTALPKLGRPGWEAMTKVVSQALKTPTDSGTFATQMTVLKLFSEIDGLAGSRRWQAVELILGYSLTQSDSTLRAWRNAMMMASVLGDRGIPLVANAKPLDGNVETFQLQQMGMLMAAGPSAAPEVWKLMVVSEGVRNEVLHLADADLLVELLGVSRNDPHVARIEIAKKLQFRLGNSTMSRPEMSVGIAHAMANFVSDVNPTVQNVARSCVRAFSREPAWAARLADGFVQNLMSSDSAEQAHGEAGLRTMGTSAMGAMDKAYSTYEDRTHIPRLQALFSEMMKDHGMLPSFADVPQDRLLVDVVMSMSRDYGELSTDDLMQRVRDGLRYPDAVIELATRGAVGAMALADLAKTTTGDILEKVLEAEKITAGRAVRSWPDPKDGQWRDGPMRYLGEVLDEFRVRALLADMKSAPDVLRTMIDRVNHLLWVASTPRDIELSGSASPQYRLDALKTLAEIGGVRNDAPAPWYAKAMSELNRIANADRNPDVRVAAQELVDQWKNTELSAAEFHLTFSQLWPRIEVLTASMVSPNPVEAVAALYSLYNSALDLLTVNDKAVQSGRPSMLRPVMDQLFNIVEESDVISVRAVALRVAAYLDRDATMPRINEILSGDGSPAELRLAAIAALGDRRLELTDEATGLERYEVRRLTDRLAEYRGRGENPTELAAILRILPSLGKQGVDAIPVVVDLVMGISVNGGDGEVFSAAGTTLAYYAQMPETKDQPELRSLLNGEHPELTKYSGTADKILARIVKCVGPTMYPTAVRWLAAPENKHFRRAMKDVLSDALPTDLVELMPTATPEERPIIAQFIEKNLRRFPDDVHYGQPEHVAKVMIDYVDDPNAELAQLSRAIVDSASNNVLARIWIDELHTSEMEDGFYRSFEMPGDIPLPPIDREGLKRRAEAGLRYMGVSALPAMMETLRDTEGNTMFSEGYRGTLRELAEDITATALRSAEEAPPTSGVTADIRALLEVVRETTLKDLIRRRPGSHLAAAAIDVLAHDVRGSAVLTELWMDPSLPPDTRETAREALRSRSFAASLAFARSPGGLGPREDQRRDRLSEDGMKMSEAGPRNFLEALRSRGK